MKPKGYIDLDQLRDQIAQAAEEIAAGAGIENPRARVELDLPSKGKRTIRVYVSHASKEDYERQTGLKWQDN
jgi:hypothetical protein